MEVQSNHRSENVKRCHLAVTIRIYCRGLRVNKTLVIVTDPLIGWWVRCRVKFGEKVGLWNFTGIGHGTGNMAACQFFLLAT